MTSWTYKWFDPARHNADEFAETCIDFLLGLPRSNKA